MRAFASLAALALTSASGLGHAHPWPTTPGSTPLADRISPPAGFTRLEADADSFGAWLRTLPVRPGRPDVLLFDGRKKFNQRAQHAVLDVDVGSRDLQQCADAVFRLHAEWQWASRRSDICYRYTSGDAVRLADWQRGLRPQVEGRDVRFMTSARPSATYPAFRKYLDSVFGYAGSFSLARDLDGVDDPRDVLPGDVWVRGGFPGHAVIVLDVAQNAQGDRAVLLAQSYMPAQDIHVLRNPASAEPWYRVQKTGRLETPEWTFNFEELRRFRKTGCTPQSGARQPGT